MATDLQNLQTWRSNIYVQLAAMAANPQPSYTKGNQTFNWTEMRAELVKELDTINAQIMIADGPWEIETQG